MTEKELWEPHTWSGVSFRIDHKPRPRNFPLVTRIYLILAGLVVVGVTLLALSGAV